MIESKIDVEVECNLYDDWVGTWKHVPSIFDDSETAFRFHDNGACEFVIKTDIGWVSLINGWYWVCSKSYAVVNYGEEPIVEYGTWSMDGDRLTLLWFDGDLAHELEKD